MPTLVALMDASSAAKNVTTSLLMFGTGDSCELGALNEAAFAKWTKSDEDDVELPHTSVAKRPTEVRALNDVPIIQVAAGGIHTLPFLDGGQNPTSLL